MKINMRSLGLGVVFALSACASGAHRSDVSSSGGGSGQPDWITHPQANYPENQYLVAVGMGKDRNEAIQDAKKNLAESFLVRVSSESVTHKNATLAEDSTGSVSGKSDQDSHKNLTLSTDTTLRGADVKEVYEGKDTYALVALDKLKARSGLLMEAQKSQAKLDTLYDLLKSNYSTDQWNVAQDEMKHYEQLYSEAAALGMSALVNLSDYERKFGQLDQVIRGKIKKINFTVKINEGEEFFRNDLEACIGNRGGTVYSVEKPPANANAIAINLVERPQHYEVEGWTKMRFDLTASITQTDGKLFRIETSKTEIGRSRDAVLESAADELSKDFCDKLFGRMGDMTDNQ